MLRLTILLSMLCLSFQAMAQKPAAFVPTDPGMVLERLPRGYSAVSALSQSPSASPAAAIEQAGRLLVVAAQTGDARLASRADALLSRFPANENRPEVLRMRAFSAQHRHDFAEALRLLDRLVARDPRAGDARLARAQIHILGGRLDAARSDCATLALGVDAANGMLCVAMLSLRQGRYPAASSAVDLWLAQNADGDAEGRRFALTLRGEIAARAGERDAERHFRRALSLAPNDVRTLAAYARFLRAAQREREVEALLSGHAEHEGLQLQRALALRGSDPDKASAIAATLTRGYASARSIGRVPELRDEAELMLSFRGDPKRGLMLAQRNFRDQRDEEDVDLLYRAAVAAQDPQALRQLREWTAAQRLPLPKAAEAR